MQGLIEKRASRNTVAIQAVTDSHAGKTRKALSNAARQWLDSSGFKAQAGQYTLLPAADGKIQTVLAGHDPSDPVWSLANLPLQLPEGTYCLGNEPSIEHPDLAALGWALGSYCFDKYRDRTRKPARLAVERKQLRQIRPIVEAVTMVRDLVNTPTQDLGPSQLASCIKKLATKHKARCREWVGKDLLKNGYPTIHAVGRAAKDAPRLVELSWGKKSHPKLTLVGKGVCFDSGGLDLKPATGMRNMKKDMGGSAHAIALAHLVMQAKLPVQLTLLVPAVENAVGADAFRPGDVITTRAGIHVEVDNTDAEGRLVLCDALAHASEQNPDLIIDFATLTGAARVALGPDLPAMFSNNEQLAADTLDGAARSFDPIWRMPLWQPYQRYLKSGIADCLNSANTHHAGAITAALYLSRFVSESTPWLHFDVYAWNDHARPGRPQGGEAMALRATYEMLRARFG